MSGLISPLLFVFIQVLFKNCRLSSKIQMERPFFTLDFGRLKEKKKIPILEPSMREVVICMEFHLCLLPKSLYIQEKWNSALPIIDVFSANTKSLVKREIFSCLSEY